MLAPRGPVVRRDLLVGGHVGHVVDLALLGLVHGLVGLLVPPAQAEAPPEASWVGGGEGKGGGQDGDDVVEADKRRHETKRTSINLSRDSIHLRGSKFHRNYTHSPAAVQLDLWRRERLGEHLRGPAANSSRCSARLSFMTAIFSASRKGGTMGHAASLGLAFKNTFATFFPPVIQ